jgi:hypothetical protein
MAPFRSPDDFDRLDWEILRNGPLCLYHSRDVLDEHVGWFGRHGYVVHAFDCSSWASERDLHEQLDRALHFPDYYGRNLIALEECLCGVEVPDYGGVAPVLTAFDAFAKRFPNESWHLLNVIALTSRYVLLTGRRPVAPPSRRPPAWTRATRPPSRTGSGGRSRLGERPATAWRPRHTRGG